jgi:hypothetical protein
MKTSIILRFEDLSEEDRTTICNWLSTYEDNQKIPFKLFYRKGGINNKMLEYKRKTDEKFT